MPTQVSGSLGASRIQDSTVTANKIPNGTITLNKLASNVISDGLPPGSVLQTVVAQDDTYKSLTWSSNWGPITSDTLFDATAGAEIISETIKPSSVNSKILVSFAVPFIAGSTTFFVSLVLFRGTTSIQAEHRYITLSLGGTYPNGNQFVVDAPNTVSPTIYSVRVARVDNNTGTIYINGQAGGRRGGGTYKAALLLQEIKG